jgi:hypothetical protein
MPQESLSTFLPGQKKPDSSGLDTATALDKPIYEFLSRPSMGANQPSASLTATALGTGTSAWVSKPTSLEHLDRNVPSGVFLRPRFTLAAPGRAPKLKTRQLWEGTITEVREGECVAVLRDKTNPRNPDELATFTFDDSEISPEDQKLAVPGAAFYWVIGTQRTFAGQVQNVSMVQFRRVPRWTQRKLSLVAERARQLRKELSEKQA